MLRLKHETDLEALELTLDPNGKTQAITLATKKHLPDIGIIGSIEDLIPVARTKREGLSVLIKARKEAEGYETAAWYEYGEALSPIRKECKRKGKGYWGQALIEIGEITRKRQPDGSSKIVPGYNRAEEAINFTVVFKNKAEAARVNVQQALKLIRRDERCYNVHENCFGTDEWLREALIRDFGFPGLDVCSSHGKHFGERFYAPFDDDPDTLDAGEGAIGFDGLKQDWAKDCPREKIIWCNSPYYRPILEAFTELCYETSQQDRTVVQLLPPAEWSDNYRELVIPHAEIRRPSEPVLQDGFGPKADKPAKMGRDYINVVVAIWRKGQKGFDGPPIYPVGKEPTTAVEPPKIIIPPQPEVVLPAKASNFRRPFEDAKKSDEYYTPVEALNDLLPYLPKDKVIWDMAWGEHGSEWGLPKHLREAGFQIVGGPKGHIGGFDGLMDRPPKCDIIVTNVPYSEKDKFLARAYSLGKPFAMILPVEAIGGGRRSELFREHGIELLIPNRRYNFIVDGGQTEACSLHTGWFCWRLLPPQFRLSPDIFIESGKISRPSKPASDLPDEVIADVQKAFDESPASKSKPIKPRPRRRPILLKA